MEQLLVYPFLVAFVALFVTLLRLQGPPLRGDLLDRFESLAKTIKGTLDPGTWFRKPRLRFDASGCPAEIRWVWTGRGEMATFWLVVRASGLPPGDLKMWSKMSPWRPRWDRPWGCPAVVLGAPAIDGDLAIRSRPPALAERLFAPERRAEAADLLRGLVGDDTLSIRGGVLETSFEVNSMTPGGISQLVSRLRKMIALLQESAR